MKPLFVKTVLSALALSAAFTTHLNATELSSVEKGLLITPVKLNLAGKNRALVGLGSYLVNSVGGCNDCHTNPKYKFGNDPFKGEPEKVNAAQYLAGGGVFGPFTATNITPNALGKPAGLTLTQFVTLMRTGVDPHNQHIMQVMPWPVYKKMRTSDLQAIYEYLRAIPSLPNNY